MDWLLNFGIVEKEFIKVLGLDLGLKKISKIQKCRKVSKKGPRQEKWCETKLNYEALCKHVYLPEAEHFFQKNSRSYELELQVEANTFMHR